MQKLLSMVVIVTAAGSALLFTLSPARANAAESGADTSLALEEIVVTARRREESLQSVPVAVSVLTGDA